MGNPDIVAPERQTSAEVEVTLPEVPDVTKLAASGEWSSIPSARWEPKTELLGRLATVSKAQSTEGGNLPPAWISDYMTEQALWATDLLKKLRAGEHAGAYDKLNIAVLNACEGLAFIRTTKGGLGLTLAHGYGFLIKKLEQDQYGNSRWSQPLFFAVSQTGLGLSFGYQTTESVIALLSLGAVDVFKRGITSVGTDLAQFSTDGALVGMSGGAAWGNGQHLGLSVNNKRSAFCYSKVGGAYLELGMHVSRVSHDRASNAALYGDDYDPEQVLSKAGQFFTEMLPLLRTINLFGKQAMGLQ